jgi:uncharacterized protein YhaN
VRIDALRLHAFGPFTDKILDFSAANKKLHIVFGPNEAGKSTLLRALNVLLFGFSHTSGDAHVHALKDLRVGASIRRADGTTLEITRFKRRKNDLVDASGRALEQSRLLAWLGGISPELFTQLFGLNQEKLREGAENLLLGQGDLGQALFAAASGIVNLRQVLDDLQKRQDGLFKPRASSTEIMKSIAQLANLTKELKECSVKPNYWKRLHQNLLNLQAGQEDLQRQIFETDKAIARHQRHRGALKYVNRRENLENRLCELLDVPLVSEDFTERRAAAQEALIHAKREAERLSLRLVQITDECASLIIDRKLLDLDAEIQRLHQEAVAHSKAAKDSRLLKAKCEALQASIIEKQELLGHSTMGAPFEKLPKTLKIRMESLSRTKGGLDADRKSAILNLEQIEINLGKTKTELSGLALAGDTHALENALAKAGDLGNPVQRLSEIQSETRALTLSLEADRHELGLKSIDMASLCVPFLPSLPLPESIERFETEMDALSVRAAENRKDIERLERALLEKESALARMEKDGDLPDPAVLDRTRDLRDKGWALIKQEWLAGKIEPEQTAAFLCHLPDQANLCTAFEQLSVQADALADDLFHNAQQVAQAMDLRLGSKHILQELELIRTRITETSRLQADLDIQWRRLWADLHIPVRSPREMRAWLGKALDMRRRSRELLEKKAMLANLQHMMEQSSVELRQAILKLGQMLPDNEEFPALLRRGKTLLAVLTERQAAARELRRRVQELTTSKVEAERRLNQAVSALLNWEKDWTATLSEMAMPTATSPEAAQAAAHTLEEIAGQRRELQAMEKRIADIDQDYQEFQEQIFRLRRFAPVEATQISPENLIGMIHAALNKEKDKSIRHEALLAEKSELEQQLHSAQTRIVWSEQTLAGLCAEVGCTDAAGLPQAEARSRARRETQLAFDQVEERLLELAEGDQLETFMAEARTQDPDELSARLERLAATKLELAGQRDACLAEIGRVRAELNALDGTSRTAEINQGIHETRAKLQEQIDHFLRLRLAGALLSREIERFREDSQGPVLAASSRFFEQMTLGAFSGLLADYNDKGDPVIRAVRKNKEEQRLDIDQLSEGTRDQLFLALRLGGLWRYVQINPPLPLIVDDILVNFDDQRSTAALRILAEIATSTQVLFFTHHSHLVDIALENLPAGTVEVIRLDVTSPSPATPPALNPVC